jgi:hypothetical protein
VQGMDLRIAIFNGYSQMFSMTLICIHSSVSLKRDFCYSPHSEDAELFKGKILRLFLFFWWDWCLN